MSTKCKLFSLFFGIFFITESVWAAKELPNKFFLQYQLYQAGLNAGKVIIIFSQKQNQYYLKASISTEGILKLFGDKEIKSDGIINSKGFVPNNFEAQNFRNPKKNILVAFDRQNKKIIINYKNNLSEKKYTIEPIDLASLLLQFNFEKNKEHYDFNVVTGKKIKEFKYKKLKNEIIKIGSKSFTAEAYEGNIVNKKNHTHFIWLSKSLYRIPIKIRIRTKLGFLVDAVLVKTSLSLKH